MSGRLLTLLLFIAGETAEPFVARMLVDAAAVYRARLKRADVEAWLCRQGVC